MNLPDFPNDKDFYPSPIKFERVVVEDVQRSKKEGRFIGKEVHLVHESAPGSRDIFKAVVDKWLAIKEADVRNGRIPQKWLDAYRDAYERWKRGQEVPLNGTPIKGWGVISPVQQEELIRINVVTVEALASLNDEGIKRIGPGALDLKNKAIAFLQAAKDTGVLVMENADLKKRLAIAEANQEDMRQKLAELTAQIQLLASNQPVVQATHSTQPTQAEEVPPAISVSDILAEPEAQEAQQPTPIKRGPGRPRKVEQEPKEPEESI